MDKYQIIVTVALFFCMGMTLLNAMANNLPMTIMWGCISIFEVVMFSIVILSDANVGLNEREDKS